MLTTNVRNPNRRKGTQVIEIDTAISKVTESYTDQLYAKSVELFNIAKHKGLSTEAKNVGALAVFCVVIACERYLSIYQLKPLIKTERLNLKFDLKAAALQAGFGTRKTDYLKHFNLVNQALEDNLATIFANNGGIGASLESRIKQLW